MLTLSAQTIYGVSALLDLASESAVASVRIDDIAQRQKIPPMYLRHILIALKKANLVKSIRGTRGGYCLACDPAKITIREIVEALEGPIRVTDVAIHDRALAEYWRDVQERIYVVLEEPLEKLLARSQQMAANIIYHI